MKTISLKVGDMLEALVDRPVWAPIPKGGIVKVAGFGPDGAPTVTYAGYAYPDTRWYTSRSELFHHYTKVTKGGK